jgi:hypothetical protein
MTHPNIPNASFPLDIIIKDLLRDEHCVPISPITAEVILMQTGNKHFCHIQFPSNDAVDITGRFITKPHLWSINEWRSSSEKWMRDKIKSQQRRDAQFVYEGNVRLISRAILRFAYVHPDAAVVLARTWIDKSDFGRIKAVGVKQLYNHVKELP